MEFPASFTVNEQGVTEIQLEISPYASLTRYQDQFYFQRKIVITGISSGEPRCLPDFNDRSMEEMTGVL